MWFRLCEAITACAVDIRSEKTAPVAGIVDPALYVKHSAMLQAQYTALCEFSNDFIMSLNPTQRHIATEYTRQLIPSKQCKHMVFVPPPVLTMPENYPIEFDVDKLGKDDLGAIATLYRLKPAPVAENLPEGQCIFIQPRFRLPKPRETFPHIDEELMDIWENEARNITQITRVMQDDDIKRVGSFRRTSFRAYLAAKADQEHIEERTRGGPAMAAVCWVDTMTRLSPEQAVIHWDKFKQKTHFLAQICMCATQTTSCTNSINYLDACSIQARLFDTMYGNGIPPDDFTSSLMGVHTILPLPSNIVIMEGNHDLLREPISFTKNFPAFAGLMFPKYDTINLGIGFLPPPNNFSEMGSIWHFPPARAQITMEESVPSSSNEAPVAAEEWVDLPH